MVLYMKVTSDVYELPVAVAGSPRELAEMLGESVNAVRSIFSHNKNPNARHLKNYIVVDMGDEL